MEAVIQSLLSGFPLLMFHSSVTLAMLAVASMIYLRVTPHDELALIRDGNTAAAVSTVGGFTGLALPLAFTLASSVNIWDIVIWGGVTLVLQIIAFFIVDRVLQGLPKRIEDGELASAILLAGVKLAVAAINAAAIVG